MGDPIFTGFDGVKFEFQGHKDKFYNLLSAPEHLVRGRALWQVSRTLSSTPALLCPSKESSRAPARASGACTKQFGLEPLTEHTSRVGDHKAEAWQDVGP